MPRHAARPRPDEDALTAEIVGLASAHGRYGYRRVTALRRAAGWRVDAKRVERIWRREGLEVPRQRAKRGRLGLNDGSRLRPRPERPDHVWAYDLVQDRTHDGKVLRMLTVVDEFTRECPAIRVERRLGSDEVPAVLAELSVRHGPPEHVRSDNGPEFAATAVRAWPGRLGVGALFIAPGSPREHGYRESFNGELRDELPDREIFCSLRGAQVLVEAWRRHDNAVRPHSALGHRPPAPGAVPGSARAPLRPTAGQAAGVVYH